MPKKKPIDLEVQDIVIHINLETLTKKPKPIKKSKENNNGKSNR